MTPEKITPVKRQDRAARRANRTREKLLDAALVAFSEHGVDLTTIEDITERADVGKGTLYRHFEDKQAILQTLIDRAAAHLVERIQNPKVPPATLADVLSHLFDVHVAFYMQSAQEFLLMFQGPFMLKMKRGLPPDVERSFDRYLAAMEQPLAGVLPPTDAAKLRRLACAIAGIPFGFLTTAAIGMKPEDLSTGIEGLKRAFLAGAQGLLA